MPEFLNQQSTIAAKAAELRASTQAQLAAMNAAEAGDPVLHATRPDVLRPSLPLREVSIPDAPKNLDVGRTVQAAALREAHLSKLLGTVQKTNRVGVTESEQLFVPPPSVDVARCADQVRTDARSFAERFIQWCGERRGVDAVDPLVPEKSALGQAMEGVQVKSILAAEAVAGIEKINDIARPAKESLDTAAVTKSHSMGERIKQEGYAFASTWLDRTKWGAAAVGGATMVANLGVWGTIGAIGAGVGLETAFRIQQARAYGVEVQEGVLPGVKTLAEKINTALTASKTKIIEAHGAVARAVEKAGNSLREKIVARISSRAEIQRQPDVAATIETLEGERQQLLHALQSGSGFGSEDFYSDVGTRTLDMPVTEVMSHVLRGVATTLPPQAENPQSVVNSAREMNDSSEEWSSPGYSVTAEVPIDQLPFSPEAKRAFLEAQQSMTERRATKTAYQPLTESKVAEPPSDPHSKERAASWDPQAIFQTIQAKGVEGIYETVPAIDARITALDEKFVSRVSLEQEYDRPANLKEYLTTVAETATRLETRVAMLQFSLSHGLEETGGFKRLLAEVSREAGEEVDVATFDAAEWSQRKFRSMEDTVGMLTDEEGYPANSDPKVLEALTLLVRVAVGARKNAQ